MIISELFQADWVVPDLKSQNKEDLFKEITDLVARRDPALNRDVIFSGLWDREKKMTTGIARNVALPHTHIPGLKKTIGLLGVSREGIEYQSLDSEPVHLVFFLIGDDDHPDEHIKVLRTLALLLTNPEFYPSMMKAKTPKDIAATVEHFEGLSEFYFS